MKKIGFQTLGCRVNDYLSNYFQETARDLGWQIVHWQEATAQAYLINTCLVTRQAESKSRQAIRRLRRQNPEALIIVTGCLAALRSKDYPRPPEADLVFYDQKDFADILKKIKDRPMFAKKDQDKTQDPFSKIPSGPSRIRANLLIATGCNNQCSFCLVRTARGQLASRQPEEILAEARQMIARGSKEIIITGVNLGSYGRDKNKKSLPLTEVLKKIDGLSGLLRWRLSSLEPLEVTPRLILTLARAGKFCRYFHLPLQSGSAATLTRMNRPYSPAAYAKLIARIRRLMPDALFGTDIITGFPGETKREFEQTLTFLRKMDFFRLHVFPFSARPGTPAAGLKPVEPKIIQQRVEILKKLRQELLQRTQRALIGQKVLVLTEQEKAIAPRQFEAEGLTDHYLRVIFSSGHSRLGQLVPVLITGDTPDYLKGQAV